METLTRLLDVAGVNSDARNSAGQTALHLAAQHNRITVLQRLLTKDRLSPNATDS